MAVPLNPHFDRYAVLSDGLVQVSNEVPFIAGPTGVALVTSLITAGIWSDCYDAISTAWTACYSAVSTVWSDCYTAITTIWTNT